MTVDLHVVAGATITAIPQEEGVELNLDKLVFCGLEMETKTEWL